jgi:transposase-like protein
MCPLRYYPMLRQSKDPVRLRFELVRYAREHGIKPAAREFGTTVKTVRKWLRRWEPGSLRGLADRSRAPHHPRQGITAGQRRRAVSLKCKRMRCKDYFRARKCVEYLLLSGDPEQALDELRLTSCVTPR